MAAIGLGQPKEEAMPAFMKLGDVAGEATDKDHQDWIILQSMSSPIHRSIPQGAKDQQRTKGETTLGDIVVVRQLDKSSTKLAEACANGTFFSSVEIHFCATVGNKQEPYLKYVLSDVIVTSYSFHGNSSGDPIPSEEVTLGFSKIEWTYVIIDPKTGKPSGNVPGKYTPGAGTAD
jgi:type VI secretion system secreted protein Hcp